MPPRTSRSARATTGPDKDAGQATKAKPAGRGTGPAEDSDVALQTLSQFLDARPFTPRSPSDEDPLTRSFQLVVGVVERAKATADGIQHRTYDTTLEGEVPASLSALVTEALNASCTYYENLLNNGEEFRRVRQLKRGPTAAGAQQGAQKRSQAAAGRRAAEKADPQ